MKYNYIPVKKETQITIEYLGHHFLTTNKRLHLPAVFIYSLHEQIE